MDDAYVKTIEEVVKHFNVDTDKGLTQEQVVEAQKQYGKNGMYCELCEALENLYTLLILFPDPHFTQLPPEESTPLLELILEQFKDQLVIILLFAAAVSFVLALLEEPDEKGTAFVEPIVILLILIANATVGVVQETNAEKAIEALKEYSPDEAKVLRDGHLSKIHASDLVPGDIIDVSVGDQIPADSRLINIISSTFRVDQAILTGESVSVNKDTAIISDKRAVKQDQINILFSGTSVVIGKARAIVVKTGTGTAIGDIHKSISAQISERTPLKRKLDDFGDLLAKVRAIYYFKIAVALAVAAIPEGLAVVITTCLALGTKKMAKKNAIVRSLPSVETLGCTSVICSDKTGTLTTNQMSVSRVLVVASELAKFEEFHVEGSSYAPVGNILNSDSGKIIENLPSKNHSINELAQVCALCNDSHIAYDESNDIYRNVGEPTEAALKVLVEKIGSNDESFNLKLSHKSPKERVMAVNTYYGNKLKRLATLEFSRDRKSMSVIVIEAGNSSGKLLVKGAPESILDRCTSVRISSTTESSRTIITPTIREKLNEKIFEYGRNGLRVLAIAVVDSVSARLEDWNLNEPTNFVDFEQKMTFIGLVGMLDPPRPEVSEAIRKCKTAGIRVIVITGDNKDTAESICRKIGIFGEHEDLTGKSFTGREFDGLSAEKKAVVVRTANLFSRTEPSHKSELVDLLQGQGEIVAMTGDGVNDAPALKKADIGVAMGSGTDVAKLAADMILADDNFATIESAVEEGRSIYNNTKQFIRYLISSNIGEVVSIFLTVLLGMPEALIPVQLLWVNLVTDGLPATALGFNPPDHEIMRQPPRNSREPIVGKWLFFRYMIVGTYVGAATVFAYAWWFMFYQDGPQISYYQLTSFHNCDELFPEIGCEMFINDMSRRATTMSLTVLVTIEMLNAMNSLSENESLLTLPLWENFYLVFAIALSMVLHFMVLYVPFFSNLFAILPLNWIEWKAVLWISGPVIVIDELMKFFSRKLIAPPAKIKKE
ncbi:5501_t:CDS:10 [Ambispora gerdemannii]|uniref:Calcium-transporting ATPase n=1 Tax=Ambispora gerdemannii TaxID=144530 RepID=A0A9N9BDH4_9GLOM|nr:5501_t:CDS:10 [Ambispora gerdemannii]